MNQREDTIDRFGQPFYDKISKHSVLSKVFFPVSPEGYHVTLIGMEYAKVQFSGQSVEKIYGELEASQKYLDRQFPNTVCFYAKQGNNKRGPGLEMTPNTTSLRNKCRTAEKQMKYKLGINKKYPQNCIFSNVQILDKCKKSI